MKTPLPIVLALVGLSFTAAPRASLADTSKSEEKALVDRARALYEEADIAYGEGRWAEARASYLAAWALTQHWQIAGNLADCEVRLKRFRDAAEHAAYYRDEAPDARRVRAEDLLRDAMKHVAAVTISVDEPGAEIFVDDERVGSAPLDREVFIEPGTRKLSARISGRKDVVVTITLTAGESAAASLSFSSPSGGDAKGEPSSRDDRILVGGAVVGGLAAVTGVVFTVLSSVAASDAQSRTEKLAASGKQGACERQPSECEGIDASLGDSDTFANVALFSFVGAGAVGAATLAYALLVPAKAPDARTETGLRITPTVAPSGGGLFLSGRF